MKNILALFVTVFLLSACGEPVSQDQWKQYETNMREVSGFEDCIMAKFKTHTTGDPILVIRCPSSSATTSYKIQRGKAYSIINNTVVDQSSEYDQKKKQVDEIEQQFRQALKELREIKEGSQK